MGSAAQEDGALELEPGAHVGKIEPEGGFAVPLPETDEPLNIVTFTEVDGRTTLTLLVQTTSKELRDMIIDSGMEAGLQEQMDALEQVAIGLGSW